jgi:hypothetical protein
MLIYILQKNYIHQTVYFSKVYCYKFSGHYILLLLLLLLLRIRETIVSLQFLNLRQSVGLLGRRISPAQGRYLTQTDIHALSEIRTHDPSVRTGEDISFLRLWSADHTLGDAKAATT